MAGNANVAGRSVVSKVAAILRCFDAGRPCTLRELCRTTDLPLSTTYRLVTDLVASGVMSRSGEGLYRLRYRSTIARSEPRCHCAAIREWALPVLHDLVAVTHRTTRFSVLRDLQAAYIEHAVGNPAATEFDANSFLPLHASAMGKILLAFSPPDLFEAATARGLKSFTARTITDPTRLRGELIQIRRTGVAVNWGELDAQSSAMAVAVFGERGRIVGALGLPVSGQAEVGQLQQATLIAGRSLSRQLAAAAMTPVGQPPVDAGASVCLHGCAPATM